MKQAFDQEAKVYDANFTHTSIGKYQRARVYYFLEKYRVLEGVKDLFEINCGTGYDAEQFYKMEIAVTATDASKAMIELAKSKRKAEINFYSLKIQDIADDNHFIEADLLFSNFGGLNCLSPQDLKSFTRNITEKQTSGKRIVFVIMPKHCCWEDLYLLLKGKWTQLGRRNTVKALEVNVGGETVATYYHSPQTIKQLLSEAYEIKTIRPIAFFIPPSYLEPFFKKRSWLLKMLNQFEKLFGRFELLSAWSDHYIVIAERK